ncbi:MAG: hypothetical protein PWP37_1626 [Thermotogota bacterium]|nr:hypothetical protein [Thermotogota bacterium]MDK2865434.1 hypothetical protein [Thermotogota bacterium]HCZ06923.1 hydroxyacid dehydrogenase [Thermotogota bacterium]
MKTILFLNRLTDYWMENIQKLKEEFPQVSIITYKDVEHPRELLSQANGVVAGHLSKEDLEKAKNLEIIFVPFAGVDMLPMREIKERNIMVSNAHGNARYVAERALTLVLALLGRVVEYHKDLEKGIWHGFAVGNAFEDRWVTLFKRRCAILGLGRIGRELARLLKAFDCTVIGFKRSEPSQPLPYVDRITTDLDQAIEATEIIFVTLPLTPETLHLIDEEILSKMKNKYLVNVGRGRVVKEKALYEALRDGVLAGAAIDVWYQYPEDKEHNVLPSRYPIHTFKNVVISPHISGIVEEAIKANAEETMENIKSWLKTGKPVNQVDPEMNY